MDQPSDPTSLAGKDFPVQAHVPLVVVGAGPAGLAAAIEAARLGMQVMLVDEHPVGAGLIGMDVPYLFGGRVDPAVQNKPRMMERIVAARPDLEAAFDAGIEVLLGVYVWGAFTTGPTSRTLPRPLLGLADDARSWLVSYDRLIVAAGARDLALAFPGWDRPGVVGAQGFGAATALYRAFAGRRIAVLGGGAVARLVVTQALAAGLDVAAVVDVGTTGPAPLQAGHAVRGVLGAMEVEGLRIGPVGNPDAAREIACDTIVCAIDVVPNVELFDLLACKLAWDDARGGYVPVVDGAGRTSIPGIYAAGDCAGISDAGLADSAIAAAAGLRAARACAFDAGFVTEAPDAPAVAAAIDDRDGARRAWLQVHAGRGDDSLTICQCEEVSLRDLLGVRPPRYLEYDPARFAHRDLRRLAADGPLNQDQIKRLTRAGMGPCQGRRCRDQVQALLALQGNQPTGGIPMPSFRAPLRPLPLSVLASAEESADMRRHWSAWFGIASAWLPQWEPVPPDIDGLASLPEIMK